MLELADVTAEIILKQDNPWWNDPAQRLSTGQAHPQLHALHDRTPEHEHPRPIIITGRRQTGKRNLGRSLINKWLEGDTSPKGITYIRCDNPALQALTLSQIINLNVHSRRILLEAVHYQADWEQQLHQISRDRADLIICATSEFLPQNTSGFNIRQLSAPLFYDYCHENDIVAPLGLATDVGWAQATQAYEQAFLNYINDSGACDAAAVLRHDGYSLFGINKPQELLRLFSLLAANDGAEISIEALAQETAIAKNTIKKHLDYMESASLIMRQYRVGPNAQPLGKQKFFRACITGADLRTSLLGAAPDSTDQSNNLIHSTLAAQWSHTPFREHLHYRPSSKRGNSTDDDGICFVGRDPNLGHPLMAGMVDRYGTADKEALAKFMASNNIRVGLLLTQGDTGKETVLGQQLTSLPLAFYAYFIGMNIRRDEEAGTALTMGRIFELGL